MCVVTCLVDPPLSRSLSRTACDYLSCISTRVPALLCSPKDTPGNKISARVLERVFNKAPVYYRDGGTIPALAYFQSILGVDTTGFGFGLGDHIHAPNERTPAGQFHIGRTAYVEMLAELGKVWPASAVKGSSTGRKKHKRPSKKGSSSSSEDEFEYEGGDKQEL